jgi:hypothetical protein
MLFGEIIAVYCENHMEHTNTLREQNAETLYMYKNPVRTSHETYVSLLDLLILICEDYKLWISLLRNFLNAAITSSLLGSNIPNSALLPNILTPCSSHNVRAQVSHP